MSIMTIPKRNSKVNTTKIVLAKTCVPFFTDHAFTWARNILLTVPFAFIEAYLQVFSHVRT